MLTFDSEKHAYFIDGEPVPSVTQILTGGDVNPWWSPRGRERGTAVHSAIEFLLDNDLDWGSIDPAIAPYVKAFQSFWAVCKPEAISKEGLVYSRKHRYAGRYDLYARVFGLRMLIDIKTGEVPSWAGAQLEAYAHAMAEEPQAGQPGDWSVTVVQTVRVLQLKANGTAKLIDPGNRSQNWAKFLEARRLYDEQRAAGDGPGGAPGAGLAGEGAWVPDPDQDGNGTCGSSAPRSEDDPQAD